MSSNGSDNTSTLNRIPATNIERNSGGAKNRTGLNVDGTVRRLYGVERKSERCWVSRGGYTVYTYHTRVHCVGIGFQHFRHMYPY